jgi:hypothetical protein
MIRPYQELIGAPNAWIWKEHWKVQAKSPFVVLHGIGYGGINGHRNAAMDLGCSTAIGHIHSHGGIAHIATAGGRRLWGMNTGCLIDVDAYAFQYGRDARNKPVLGLGVVVDDGKTPIFIPYNG